MSSALARSAATGSKVLRLAGLVHMCLGEQVPRSMLVLSCVSRFSWKAGGMGRPVWCLPLSRHVLSRASRSVIHPTRLETRTKESNICASHSVLNRLEGRNESKWYDPGVHLATGGLGAVPTRLFPFLWMWRSLSVHVGTRKMVNYAWARRSQRKLWWRSVAILTCKSIVRPGYRGERLIEPSSSWFPLKFPSG